MGGEGEGTVQERARDRKGRGVGAGRGGPLVGAEVNNSGRFMAPACTSHANTGLQRHVNSLPLHSLLSPYSQESSRSTAGYRRDQSAQRMSGL